MFSLCALSLFLLSGCGQQANAIPNAIIIQSSSTLQLPKAADIKSMNIANDGAVSLWMVPQNPNTTIHQILKWLKSAEPVSVQLPHSNWTKSWITSGYTGPSIIYIHLKNNELVTISPAYYIWETNNSLNHYLNGIISYNIQNHKIYYFKAPLLYQWLKEDQWKPQFKNENR